MNPRRPDMAMIALPRVFRGAPGAPHSRKMLALLQREQQVQEDDQRPVLGQFLDATGCLALFSEKIGD